MLVLTIGRGKGIEKQNARAFYWRLAKERPEGTDLVGKKNNGVKTRSERK